MKAQDKNSKSTAQWATTKKSACGVSFSFSSFNKYVSESTAGFSKMDHRRIEDK
jgi:hypothetical protein